MADPNLVALLQQQAAVNTALQQQMASMQQQATDNVNALQALQATLVAQTELKDLEDKIRSNDMETFEGPNDKEHSAPQVHPKWAQYLNDSKVPAAKHVKWAVKQLRGDAATWWSGFPNPANTAQLGDVNTSWADFVKGLEAFCSPEHEVELLKAKLRDPNALRGKDVETTTALWRSFMLRFRACPTLKGYYGYGALVDAYIECLTGIVRTNLAVNKPASLEDAYIQAQTVAATLGPRRTPVAAGAAGGKPRQRGGFYRPVYSTGSQSPSPAASRNSSRAGTPMPPGTPLNSVTQELAALSEDVAMLLSGGSSGSNNCQRYYSLQNQPPPMTPDERQWCSENRACFRCLSPH
eukprot:2570758-Rhodomonas_salina.1